MNEIAIRYPNGSPPAVLPHPKCAIFAGLQIWNASAFVAQSDASAWGSGCFIALTPVYLHDGTTFTGDYEADMPGGIDLAGAYTIRLYDDIGTPTPGTELAPVQVWPGTPVEVTQVNVTTENMAISS